MIGVSRGKRTWRPVVIVPPPLPTKSAGKSSSRKARKDARRRRHLELLREQARAEEAVEPEPTSLERAQEAAIARRALECLSERDREALLMREEGLDYHEIAAALELSVGSVGTTLARARRRLVEAVDEIQRERDRRDKVSVRGNNAS